MYPNLCSNDNDKLIHLRNYKDDINALIKYGSNVSYSILGLQADAALKCLVMFYSYSTMLSN